MNQTQKEYFSSTDVMVSKKEVIADYRLACESRFVSLMGRKDVFMGRAKFGIFGDGKELAQLALSKVFRKGDFRSGYYRDQTWVAATNGLTWEQFFAQLYAHADIKYDIFSGGRSMNAHYGNQWLNDEGEWLNQTELFNGAMDVSSTAGQMPRALGLAYASKIYKNNSDLANNKLFSKNGSEVCFATIGDASTSQGMFFETINAAGVLQVPLVVSVWDDGYGISVPIEYQTTKGDISAILEGFKKDHRGGIEIIKVKGWDYVALLEAYQKAAIIARDQHVPVLVHVYEMTQQQGHSASGSHERYKSKKRLQWEKDFDCNLRFKRWILENEFATEQELLKIESESQERAKSARSSAWESMTSEIKAEKKIVLSLLLESFEKTQNKIEFKKLLDSFKSNTQFDGKDSVIILKKAYRLIDNDKIKKSISKLLSSIEVKYEQKFNTHLYSNSKNSPLNISPVSAQYDVNAEEVEGRKIINTFFDAAFAKYPELIALGEDIGKIGDVNQGFVGLQEKYGEHRITDTGIRETTIIGQGIGAAMRGLRPIVEIQYLDYIYYALSVLTDDLASLRYRTVGKQKAPLIVRTRGHRLEGIWHSGSPMGVLVNSLRGMHIVVPRNFVKAAGFYNTLLKGDDPALVIEVLNGYRRKEKMPSNIAEICEPLGIPEVLKEGNDLTIVTYGAMCKIVMDAAAQLSKSGIDVEVIDVQTLLPFDIDNAILKSIKKTSRVIFADEDMPGGASAFMMQQVLDKQDAYHYLDSKPIAISAKDHRPPYGNDGDYFSKPNVETIFDAAYNLMREVFPSKFPELY